MGNLKKQVALILFTLFFFFSSSVAPVLAAVTYLYDANGNLTSDGTKCYEYNEANQLKKVKNCSNDQIVSEYVYDYEGTRLVKKEFKDGVLQKTIYSPSDDYETVKPASGPDQNTTYYFANDELLAKKNPDGTKNYYHNDHLGSTNILTSQSGALVEETRYDPWGELLEGGAKSKFLYTGQEKDLETGLNYYNARYYDSHIRRFTQPDDIIQNVYDPQSLNRYSYVNNNPIKYTDPTGHFYQFYQLLVSNSGPITSFITRNTQLAINYATKIAMSTKGINISKTMGDMGRSIMSNQNVTSAISSINSNVSKIRGGEQNPVLRGSQNPVVQKAAEYGKQTHTSFVYPEGYKKEVILDSGKRVDALNRSLKHIIELKPDSLEAIRRGEKQLEVYLKELNETKESGWVGEIWTYPRLK